MKLRLLFIVIQLCIAGGASADDADRLIADFDRKADVASANKFFEFLDRREFTDSKIVFSNAVPADSLRQQTWYWAAEWYYDCQNYSLARDYAKRALPLMRWPNLDKSCCLNLLGIIHVRLGDFKTAVEYAKRCVDIDIRLNDPDRVSSSLNTLAGAYMAANQPQDAERYILRGLEYAERAGNPSRKAVLLGMASEIYYKLGDYSKSVDYADRAYRLDSIGGREAKMAVRLSQKGTALVGLKKYAEAEQVLLKAIAGLRASGNVHSLAINLNQLGFLMLRQDREREAVGYFSQAASLFGKMGDLYNLVNSHKGLYESYWSINPDSARIELEHFNALRDSLYSTATADALARYKTAVVVLAAVAIHRRRMRRYRAEMLALIRDVESLYGTPEPEKAPTEAAENSFERMVVDVVRQGLASGDDISVSAIASRLNLGEQTFRRRFVAETGKQPKTFVTAIQMEMAARLLASDTTVPVAEVARACGFDDASAFSHAFKKAYSCSPTQFRQKRA